MQYATAAQLTTWTGQAAPPDADRQLTRASQVIDEALFTCRYAVDSAGFPTAPAVVQALADACCAQVELWQTADEEEDILGPANLVTTGSVTVSPPAAAVLAPRAARVLRLAGLLGGGPITF